MAGRRGYVSQLNIHMRDTRLYNCSDIRGTNATRSEHTHTYTRARTIAIFNTHRKNKGFGSRCRVKLTSILYFLEHETGLSREMGSSSASLLEKSDFIIRFIHAIVCSRSFFYDMFQCYSTREKSFYIYDVHQL